MSGAARPMLGRAETFRVMAPGGCLMTWTIGTAFIASIALFMSVWVWVRGTDDVRAVGSALCFAMLIGLACAAPWLVRRLICPIRWVRVSPEQGVTLSNGRRVSWDVVEFVQQQGRVVVISVDAAAPIELRDVPDSGRLVSLVRRHAGVVKPNDE